MGVPRKKSAILGLVVLVGLALATVRLSAVRGAVNMPVLKWEYGGCATAFSCSTGWYSSPAVVDLDGDGQTDVVWGSSDVVALNGNNGSLKWRATNGFRVWPGVAVADLTGDGNLEVIVGRAGDQLTVYDRFGNIPAPWPVNPFGSGEIRSLAVSDLETDGQFEIVVGSTFSEPTTGARQMSVYAPNGSVRAGWPARHSTDPGSGAGMYNENLAVGDMNRDGFKEIFGPTDTYFITALDRSGAQLPVNTAAFPGQYWSQVAVHVNHAADARGFTYCDIERWSNFALSAPAVADVNGDGVPELVVVGNIYNCTVPNTDLYHMPFIFKLDRTRWSGSGFDWTTIPAPGPGSAPRSEDSGVIENALPSAVIADLDGDGFAEILFASYDGKLHAYSLDKTEHGSWPYVVPTAGLPGDDFRFAGEPAVADLDNDGRAEVIFTSWPKKGFNGRGQLHVLSYLGQSLYRIDLPAPRGGTYNAGLGAPTIANIDSDPDLEVVVGTISSGVVAYDLPGSAGARVLWGTGRGGLQRTGRLPSALRRAPNFDGDLRADATVYHPPTGLWYARQSSDGTTFSVGNGGPGYQPVEGDYDGDGRSDAAVYRQSTGSWLVRQSSTGTTLSIGFGGSGYSPIPRDYDGDGRTDLAVYHAATGLWYIQSSRTGTTSATGFGGSGFTPVAADYDGDGRADLAAFQEASGLWFIRQSATGKTRTVAFGGSGFTPVPRDYDGDGRADVAVYHAASGVWYVRQSSAETTVSIGFGGSGYTPVPADFDGDRRADFAVYHAGSGLWFVRQSSNGTTVTFGYGGSAFTAVSE